MSRDLALKNSRRAWSPETTTTDRCSDAHQPTSGRVIGSGADLQEAEAEDVVAGRMETGVDKVETAAEEGLDEEEGVGAEGGRRVGGGAGVQGEVDGADEAGDEACGGRPDREGLCDIGKEGGQTDGEHGSGERIYDEEGRSRVYIRKQRMRVGRS
jgi:hypothetical protein